MIWLSGRKSTIPSIAVTTMSWLEKKLVYLEHFFWPASSPRIKWQDGQGPAGAKVFRRGRPDLHPLYQYLCQGLGHWPLSPPSQGNLHYPWCDLLGDGAHLWRCPSPTLSRIWVRSCLSLHFVGQPPLKRSASCDHYRHFPPLLWGPSKRIATLRLSVRKGFTWLVA